MEQVISLVEQARVLTLKSLNGHKVDRFHNMLDSHIDGIYRTICASEETKRDFLNTIQDQSGPNGQPISECLASVDAFRAYMQSVASSAEAPAKNLDMSAPISDYFVSSSHNTYLTGNQLYSDAAASAYTSVLLRGCRSVEIDVWDGEPNDSDLSDSETSSDSDSDSGRQSGLKTKKKDQPGDENKGQKSGVISRSLSTRLNKAFRRGPNSKPDSSSAKAALDEAEKKRKKSLAEPRVLHGHTLTKGTSFREICYAIRDSAFVTSDLPVIVSFEVHCCLEQQQIMVDIMHEAWKGLLVEVSPDLAGDKLPKLADLKRKILVKTKSLPLTSTDVKRGTPEASPPDGIVVQATGDQQENPAKPTKILEALAKMAIYTKAYHFDHFEQPEAKIPGHIFSLSERACRDAHMNHRERLFEHNRSGFMRIYPFAFRVNSSNLDPAFCWRRGAQLAALNWQNVDKGMMLNHGMFNGTPGWVLKPDGYRSSEPTASDVHRCTLDIVVEVFAAQDLPLPPGDHNEKRFKPYVNCQLHVEEPDRPVVTSRDDASSDSEKSSFRRCTKSSSGINPDFKGQKLVFPTVTGVVEELTFVRFKIKDDEIGRDSLAAWACIRLDRLREGYRLVHLYDRSGDQSRGVLLIRVTKQTS